MSMFSKNDSAPVSGIIGEKDKIETIIGALTKKYQDAPDTLLKDYDEVIINSIIGIIANFSADTILRNDIIINVNVLISMREFIVNYCCNNSRDDN